MHLDPEGLILATVDSNLLLGVVASLACGPRAHVNYNAESHPTQSRYHDKVGSINVGFPKLGVWGVPIIRSIVFWGLYWGPAILGNYPVGRWHKSRYS